MSYAAERWARSQKVGNASAKFVLIELANALNKDDVECYPGIDTLEESTELNRKTVLAATKLLEEKGFIKKRRACEKGKQRIYYSFPAFNPADWEFKKESTENGTLQSPKSGTYVEQSPKNGTLESPKNGTQQSTENGVLQSPKSGTYVEQSPKNGTLESPKNGTQQSTENGVLQSPKNGPVTGNKNREIEHVIETHEDAASGSTPPKARTKKGEAWKKWIKVEKPAEVPEDLWKQFGEIRALKKMALTERALELLRSEGEKAHMTLLQVIEHCCANAWAGFKASWLTRTSGSTYRKPQNVTQTPEYRGRLQACCRGEGRTEKLADDGVTIIVD